MMNWTNHISSKAVGITVFLTLFLTSPDVLVWDEGLNVERAGLAHSWLAQLLVSPDTELLAVDEIRRHWRYANQIEGHPAGFAWISLVRWPAEALGVPSREAWRLGPMCLAACAMSSLFGYLRYSMDAVTGLAAVVVLLTTPRVFAHLHWAGLDGPLLSASVLAWIHYCQRQQGFRHRLLWSLFLGLAISTKVTGCFLIPAMACQIVLAQTRDWFMLIAGIARGACVFVALNPPLWECPRLACAEFVFRNSIARQDSQFDIPTMFFGQLRDTASALPWFGGWLWLFMTIPLVWIAFMTVSVGHVARTMIARNRMQSARCRIVRDALPFLCLLPSVRCLPGVPPHDGERLILPSFAFAAIIAAIGVGSCWKWQGGLLLRFLMRSAVIACALLSLKTLETWRSAPLSFLNWAGIAIASQGADVVEAAYYWDRLHFESMRQIRCAFSEANGLCVSDYPAANRRLASRWKLTSVELQAIWEPDWELYFVQNRQGTMSALNQSLLEYQHPVHVLHARSWRRAMSSTPRLPLIWVFRRWQVDRERQRLAEAGEGSMQQVERVRSMDGPGTVTR